MESKSFACDREGLKGFGWEFLKRCKDCGEPVFLCVGTDKVVCDSLAPIVAEILREKYRVNYYVYGGLNNIIHLKNLNEAARYIESVHADKFIVLIDATIGNNVGQIVLTSGAFAGMGKGLPIKKVGDLAILGVVGSTRNFDLYSTRLGVVVDLAKKMALGIAMALEQLPKFKKLQNM